MSKIADMFRRSPFEPLRHQTEKVMQCVACVRPMFERVRQGDFAGLEQLAEAVLNLEQQADLIKDEIRQSIPKSLFLPVYRGDLLGYLGLQDDMADAVKDCAILLTLKKLALPESIAEQTMRYVEKILSCCDQAGQVSAQLGPLADSGFAAEEVERMLRLVAAVERAEWQAGRSQYELFKALFAQEDGMRPADLMLWFRVFAVLGELAKHAEKAADRVRRMLAK